MMPQTALHSSKHKGFTIIELVIVIILLAVLSVSVISRFSGTAGFSEYTYQARLVSALRHIQNRAMFDTRPDYCFQINFDDSLPAFGPPTPSYTSGNASDTCSSNIDFNNPDYLTTTPLEMSEDNISLTTQGDSNTSFTYIRFDNHGRPSTNSATCGGGCQITFSGEARVNVCVESQGYIHACD